MAKRRQEPKTLGDLLAAGALASVNADESGGLCGCELSICVPASAASPAREDEYALDQLLRSLPLATLERFRVSPHVPTPPKSMRKKE